MSYSLIHQKAMMYYQTLAGLLGEEAGQEAAGRGVEAGRELQLAAEDEVEQQALYSTVEWRQVQCTAAPPGRGSRKAVSRTAFHTSHSPPPTCTVHTTESRAGEDQPVHRQPVVRVLDDLRREVLGGPAECAIISCGLQCTAGKNSAATWWYHLHSGFPYKVRNRQSLCGHP